MPSDQKVRVRRRRSATAVTIHEVAAKAGVSVATVSRVLNGKKIVRGETSSRVLEAAKALHYAPNVAARSLSNQRTQTIGVVLPDVHGEFFSAVIRGIDLAARAAGYHLLVSGSHSNQDEMMDVLGAMRGRVDGLMVMAPDITPAALREQFRGKIPLVLLNSADGEHHVVTLDNFGGASAMMRHLEGLGHTAIAFLRGPDANADARERLRGYRHAMRLISGTPARSLEIEGDFTEASGFAVADRMLRLSTRPTALFAANDSMAIGALSALAQRGIAVPEEMTVVGFDDILISRYVTPHLTTMAVDLAELGRRAFGLLHNEIGTLGRKKQQERIAATLIVRRSCAAPNHHFSSTHAQRVKRGRQKGE